jgi:serine/threonine-protein kinase
LKPLNNHEPLPALPGEVIAERYLVENILGRGGTGVVVSARHIALDKQVALKFLRTESRGERDGLLRFVREAQATARLESEHVVRVLDAELIDSQLAFIAMEYLKGRDLAQVLKEDGPLPIDVSIDYILQASEAIAEAHARDIIHRDIKPSNLFLTHLSDGTPFVKVLDFGLSKVGWAGISLTSENRVLGSPHFMSPEQMRASYDVDARSDIWSLGAVLYTLLAGQNPFVGEFLMEVCAAVLSRELVNLRQVRPEVSPGLEAVVSRCLSLEPIERFQNVTSFAEALGPHAAERSRSLVGRIRRVAALARGTITDMGETPDNVPGTMLPFGEDCTNTTIHQFSHRREDTEQTSTNRGFVRTHFRHQRNKLIISVILLILTLSLVGWWATRSALTNIM